MYPLGFPLLQMFGFPPVADFLIIAQKALFNVDAQKAGASLDARDPQTIATGLRLTTLARDGLIRLENFRAGRDRVAKFRIATPAGASFTVAGGGYGYEMEALAPIDAEIYEVPAGSEEEFVAAARDADALYAKGRPISQRMINGLDRCKNIALGSVGSDPVSVEAATAKGIPVTNCPDTFIEEVADHAM